MKGDGNVRKLDKKQVFSKLNPEDNRGNIF